MDKLLGALSLARKAGVVAQGFDSVKEKVISGEAFLVLTASDLSDGSRRRVETFCKELAPCFSLPYTADELLTVFRKRSGVFAVCDENFAKLCLKHLQQAQ